MRLAITRCFLKAINAVVCDMANGFRRSIGMTSIAKTARKTLPKADIRREN